MSTLYVAVRYNDKMLKKYVEDGQIKEIRQDNQPLADLTMYEGESHYFFSIVPKELDFYEDTNISVIILKTDDKYLFLIAAIAYKMFLLSLMENHDNNYRYDLKWSDEIQEKIQQELRAFGAIRTMVSSRRYYSQEEYNEFSGVYVY